MCLLIALYKVVPGYPLLLGANRDEFYERQGECPALLSRNPLIVGGRDRKAGGTWLGFNEFGVVAAVTNRRSHQPERKDARSRGLLCLEVLSSRNAREAVSVAEKCLYLDVYNPFNLFVADSSEAWALSFQERIWRRALPEGIYIVTVSDFDSANDPKIERARRLIEAALKETGDIREMIARLKMMLSDHKGAPDNWLCMHGKVAGTLSSTILALREKALAGSLYIFSQGSPCSNAYRDYSRLFSRP